MLLFAQSRLLFDQINSIWKISYRFDFTNENLPYEMPSIAFIVLNFWLVHKLRMKMVKYNQVKSLWTGLVKFYNRFGALQQCN